MSELSGPRSRTLRVPPEFKEAGIEFKAEVAAIEEGGNQTLTEVTFTNY